MFYKENIEALVAASREIDLEINAEKTKCIVMSQDQHEEQNQKIKIGNKPFERVQQFKYQKMCGEMHVVLDIKSSKV
jgi:hypothetical protein